MEISYLRFEILWF